MASVGNKIELAIQNGDTFTCVIDSSVDKSSIYLTNTATNARWMCNVNSNNLERYHTGNFELARHHRIVMAILQDAYEGNMKSNWLQKGGSLQLNQNHGIYCMELKLKCWINCDNNCWVFPMTPEDPVAILKRQKELDATPAAIKL